MPDGTTESFEAPEPTPIATAESRRQNRVRYCQEAWVVPVHDPSQHHNVMIQDISTIGAGFASAHAFPPGSWLLLTLPFPNGQWRKILCFARRCERINNGLLQTGAEFEAAIPTDGPDAPTPAAWLEWVLDQQEKQIKPVGRPVLEEELINACGYEEAEIY